MAKALRTVAAALTLVAGLGLLGATGGAQQPPPPPQQQPPAQQPPPAGDPSQQPAQPPTFRAGINFVRVDVIITDKNGSNIDNLQMADFDVTEDGKPQKLETLKLIKLDGGVAEATKEPVKQIRTDYDEEAEASRDDVRLFGIFLDDYHVRRGASLSARTQLAKFVETQLGPSDMIGVMYPLESTASVRFTRNHDAVMRGLQQFLGRKFEYEPKNEFEEKYAYYPTEVVEKIRTQVSLSAIRSMVVHMGSLKEGRKALILVSEGYSYMLPPQMRNANAQMPGFGNPQAHNPQAGVNDPMEDRAAWSADLDMNSDLREIYDHANRNNVAIYAVDPRGLAGFEFDINEGVGLQTDGKYLNSTMDTLRVLSENTDGRAIVNRNDLVAGMRQIMRDTSAYYLLGYNSSQAPADGKFHEIKVKVKRPGAQVRARKGYWALNAEQAARALAPPKPALPKPVENAINAVVTRPSSASVVRTWVGTARGENGKTRVTFVWEPLPKTPGDASGHSETPARVSLMAVGTDGSPYYRGKSDAHSVSFDVKPGKMQLRVSVEGESSQVLDSEVREVTVPDLTAPEASLGTPIVFRARTLRDYNVLKAEASPQPVAGREFSRTDRILIRVPAYGPSGAAPTVSAHLLNRSGQAMAEVPVSAAPAAGEYQAELPLANLAPGEYIVEIKVTADGSEKKELVGFRVTG